jgi:hypothetical protein
MRIYVTENKTLPIFPSWTSRVRTPSPAPSFQFRKSYTTFHYIKYSVHQHRLFELPGSFGPRLSRRLRVDIHRNTDPMAPLVSLHLRIEYPAHDLRLREYVACDLEVHPIQSIRPQFRLDVVRQLTVPPEGLSSFTGKHERFQIIWDGHLQPMAQQRGRFRRHAGRRSGEQPG